MSQASLSPEQICNQYLYKNVIGSIDTLHFRNRSTTLAIDENFNELTARITVIEQLLINVVGALSSATESPDAMVAAIVNDLQAQFAPEPDDDAAMRALKTGALRHVLQVGERLQQVTGSGTQH